MADKAPDQEPSIEEILASIRQIISDDDKDSDDDVVQDAVTAAPAPEPVKEPEPVAEPEIEEEPEPEEEDVLELTEALIEEEDPIEVDLKDRVEAAPPPPPPVAPAPPVSVPAAEAVQPESPILNEKARKAAISSMAKLAGNMPINRPNHEHSSITLEDLVREMLNPMLSDWLNSNLPPMVERIVQKELEKLARQALDV